MVLLKKSIYFSSAAAWLIACLFTSPVFLFLYLRLALAAPSPSHAKPPQNGNFPLVAIQIIGRFQNEGQGLQAGMADKRPESLQPNLPFADFLMAVLAAA